MRPEQNIRKDSEASGDRRTNTEPRSLAVAFSGRWAVWLILLLAGVLRFWGINHQIDTDENKFISPAAQLSRGSFSEFLKPLEGTYYPHAGSYLYGLSMKVLAKVWSRADADAALNARVVNAAVSTVTVAVLFGFARRLAGRDVAFWSALFLAVLPLHVKYAHHAHADTPVVPVLLLTLWASLRLWETGRVRWYATTGLLAGVTGAVQYYGLVVAAALLAGHVGRWLSNRHSFRELIRPAIVLGLVLVPVGFFLASPYIILDWEHHGATIGRLSLRAQGGALGYTRPDLLWPLLTRSPDWGMPFTVSGILWEASVPLVLLAVAGTFAVWRRKDWKILFLCIGMFLILYLAIGGFVRMHAVKRFLNLMPLLALLAAYGLMVLSRQRGSALRPLLYVLGLAAILPALWASASFDATYAGPSTLKTAVQWARSNLPEESTVLQHGPLEFFSGNESSFRVVRLREEYSNWGRRDRRVADHRARALSEWLTTEQVDYIVLDSRLVDRYYDRTSMELFPEMTASYRAFYDEIRARGERLFLIEPEPWKRAGPRIEIYDVRALRGA